MNVFKNIIQKTQAKADALKRMTQQYPRQLIQGELDYLAAAYDARPMRPEDADRQAAISRGAKEFITLLMRSCPPSSELQEAVDFARSAEMWALSSVRKGRYIEERVAAMTARKENDDARP